MRDADARDDGLRRVSRITRVAAAAGVGVSVIFAAAVAHAAPGRSPSSGSTGSVSTGSSTASGGSDVGTSDATPSDPGLQAPAQIPTPSFSRPQVSSGAS